MSTTTRFLILEWNGHKWCVNNSPHAIVAAGPYDTHAEAQAEIERRVAEDAVPLGDEDPQEAARFAEATVRNVVCIIPIDWPETAPTRTE